MTCSERKQSKKFLKGKKNQGNYCAREEAHPKVAEDAEAAEVVEAADPNLLEIKALTLPNALDAAHHDTQKWTAACCYIL
jgi:hypothetical protein